MFKEVAIAFPALLAQLAAAGEEEPDWLLPIIINTRFVDRFLQYWGLLSMIVEVGFLRLKPPKNPGAAFAKPNIYIFCLMAWGISSRYGLLQVNSSVRKAEGAFRQRSPSGQRR